MGPSVLRLIVWISLLLLTDHFSVSAQLISTTLHSTHPQVTYAPESCCMRNIFKKCVKRYDPFTMSTYVDPDGGKRTFFQTSSWGNEPNSSNMKRRVEILFHGRAVSVYGPPRAQLDNRPGRIQIFLNGIIMETIDLEHKYGEASEPWNPLLMYHWESGGGDATHTLEINLLDSATGVWKWHPIRGFGFESVVYTSLEPWHPPKYYLSESEKLEDVTIHNTNFVTSFSPPDAWEKTISAVASSEGIRTFHGTSNELAYNYQNIGVTPVAEFAAQCAALSVYGASPAQLQATFPGGFRHGHVQICHGIGCEYIDAHQAYLNVPEYLWNAPVLLYRTDRMSPDAVDAVTMRLLDPSSPVGHLWTMTFSHAICSKVVPKWPWTHPIPDGHYSTDLVQYHRLDYGPSLFGFFSPWNWMDLYSLAAAKPYWFFGLFGPLPNWSTIVQGHDIKIFIPFPTLFPASRYANVRCCIDGRCHYPDVEQWFLKARDAQSSVPLVHYQDLNPFRDHHISMTAVRRNDEAGDKIIAVSQIVYEQVVVIPQPSPTPTPSEPTESPSLPKKPIKDDDDGLWLFALAALAVTILMSIGWCFALFLLMDAQRRRPERQRLLPPQPQVQAQLPTIWTSDFSAEIQRIRSELAARSRPAVPNAGSSSNPELWTTVLNRDDERSDLSSEVDGLGSKFVPNASPGLPSNPANSQTRMPGPSTQAGGNYGLGSSSAPRNHNNGERSTISIADWIANTNSHHHTPRPVFPVGTDNGFTLFSANGHPSRIVGPSHHIIPSGYYRPASPTGSTTNPSSESQRRFSRGASGPTARDTRPFSPTYADSDIPPPYSDRSAPPSYDACVTTNAAVASLSPPNGPITVPAPPPPRWVEPATRLSTVSEQLDGPPAPRGARGTMQNNEQPGPSRPQAEGSTGRRRGRPRHYQQPQAEIAGPSLPPAEASDSLRGRGRGRGSGRGRNRSQRGRGGTST